MNTGWDGLQYTFSDGHVLYLNNFIGFIAIAGLMVYICAMFNSKRIDKALHSGISAGLTILSIWILTVVGWPWWVGPIVVFLIGLGKEIVDRLNTKKRLFDPYDLMADIVGTISITVGYVFGWVLYRG